MSEVINGVTREQFDKACDVLSKLRYGWLAAARKYGDNCTLNDVYDIIRKFSTFPDNTIKSYDMDKVEAFFAPVILGGNINASEISTFIEAFNQFIDANFPGEKHAENLKDVSDFIADLAAKVSSSEAIACQSASLFANADQVAYNLATLNEHNKQLQDQVAYLYEENEALKKQLANK
jgi:hypothetical protein